MLRCYEMDSGSRDGRKQPLISRFSSIPETRGPTFYQQPPRSAQDRPLLLPKLALGYVQSVALLRARLGKSRFGHGTRFPSVPNFPITDSPLSPKIP